jgi:hypothetical protein
VGVWLGALRFYNPASQAEFLAQNNAKITAIDVTGGIVASQLGGDNPSFVHVSACNITCTGEYVDTDGNTLSAFTVNTWEDLEYRWDFGDSSGTETFTQPTDGATVNANSDQIGPEAMYCYRTPGTYTITLTARGKNGSSYVQASTSLLKLHTDETTTSSTYAVTNWETSATTNSWPTYYFDSVNGLDANNGLSSGAPKQTTAAMELLFESAQFAIGMRFLLAEGSTFIITGDRWQGSQTPFGTNVRFDSYVGSGGAGADPIIRKTTDGGATTADHMWSGINRTSVISNIRFELLDTRTSGTGSPSMFELGAGGPTTCRHVHFDNCTFYLEGAKAGTGQDDRKSGVMGIHADPANNQNSNIHSHGLWGCDTIADGGVVGIPFYAEIGRFWGVLGCTFTALNSVRVSQATVEHWFYPHVRRDSMFRWNAFGGLIGAFCINQNWDTTSGGDLECDYIYIGDNDCDGEGRSMRFVDVNNGAGTGVTEFTSVVIERNAFHDTTANNSLSGDRGNTRTIRDNRAWGLSSPGLFDIGAAGTISAKIYRNFGYQEASAGAGGIWGFSDNSKFRPQLYTDNVVVSDKDPGTSLNAGFSFLEIDSADWIAEGSFIDRNQYYSKETGFVIDTFGLSAGGTRDATSSEWLAAGWDANGLIQQSPLWTYPVTQWSHFDDSNPITVLRVTDANKAAYRTAIIGEIFSGDGLPATGSDRITTGITNPLTALGITGVNASSVDYHELDILDEADALYGTTEFWVFHASSPNNKLVVLLLGHNPLGISVNTGNMCKDLVNAGYAVALGQPGPNLDETATTGFNSVEDHEALPARTASWNALRYFIQGPVRILNQLTGYDAYYSVGQSGGGWIQSVWGAIDPRVTRMCPHAGLMPLYISENRDWEQYLPGVVDISGGCDYPDLLALCSYPSRRVLMSINDQDATAFQEAAYLSGPDFVPAVSAFATAQGGSFALEIDTNTAHSYLSSRRAAVVAFFDAA